MKRIGVLALQGGFAAHERALSASGYAAVRVRSTADLDAVDGLVLPGGESTSQWRLLVEAGLDTALKRSVRAGLPVVATCAGLILCASEVVGPAQSSLGLLDVTVRRNGWGRHIDSFEASLDGGSARGVFIRAPRIERVGEGATVLDRLRGEPVLVQQGGVFGATFHPELVGDGRLYHQAFATRRLDAANALL